MMVLRAGMIGEHISRTRLPRALEIMCGANGWDLEFSLIDTAGDHEFDFDATVDQLRADGWGGVTVTHPYKTHAHAYAGPGMITEVSNLGASNTLVFRSGVVGYNTDYTGFLEAFANISERGPVVMAGAGGVARSIGAALHKVGVADLAIFDLDHDRASQLAESIGPRARSIAGDDIQTAVRNARGLVNATPLGMKEYPGSAFARTDLGSQVWAFDAVYTPTDTAFLKAAASAGLQVLTGFELFRHMAIRSFEAYTGLSVDSAAVLPQLEELRP